ncbi:hypothetical protein SBA3_1210025 [Candidatus Sulfopaludibacter sp. SbA3]|nr:hypothetical protein SBA3_1210025 [Candidatus Sulfopaludibacter sp. SbA3]
MTPGRITFTSVTFQKCLLQRAYYKRDRGASIFTDLQELVGLKPQPEKAACQ